THAHDSAAGRGPGEDARGTAKYSLAPSRRALGDRETGALSRIRRFRLCDGPELHDRRRPGDELGAGGLIFAGLPIRPAAPVVTFFDRGCADRARPARLSLDFVFATLLFQPKAR